MARLKSDPPESDEVREAASTSHLLHRVQQLASDRFAYLVGESGITLRQFVVMAAIADTPGLSQVDLVRLTGIDRSTLADMMLRLERRELVAREASHEDGRANAVHLTTAGLSALAAARQHAKAADAAIVDALPRTKRKVFVALLMRLSDHADKLARNAEHEAKRQAKREAKEKARVRRKKRQAESKAKPKAVPEKRKPRRKPGSR